MSEVEPSTDMAGRRGVVAVVVRDDRFLVIRRSATVLAPRAFCFPGGRIEGDESEPRALVREMQEELAAAVDPVRCVWRSTTPWQTRLAWWLGRLVHPERLVPNPAEVESVHWLTRGEMLSLAGLLESNRQFLEALNDRRIELA